MDKETLSNYGWIVICVMVLAVMLALASPFGNFVADAIKSTTQGLFDVNQGALDSAGIQIMEQEFENMLSDKDVASNPTGVTVTNGTYEHGDYYYHKTIASGSPYGANTLEEAWEIVNTALAAQGTSWQELVAMYAQYGITEEQLLVEWELTEETFSPTVYGTGWSVSVKSETQETYGPILESINGEPVTDMTNTFAECYNLVSAPAIPSNVTSLVQTFWNCTSLKNLPDMTKAQKVESMQYCFLGCTSLVDASDLVIPSSATNICGLFEGCTSLIDTGLPTIPNTVKNMNSTYKECTSLVDLSGYVIPGSVESLHYTFEACTSLEKAPVFADGIREMNCTFQECTALVDLSDLVIPSSVTNMEWTFYGCTSLRVPPKLQAGLIDMSEAFQNCTSLTDLSDYVIPSTVTTMTQTFNDCTALTKAPDLSNCTNLVAVNNLFRGCTSLTGTITLNATPTKYDYCLSETKISDILGSCANETKAAIMATKALS